MKLRWEIKFKMQIKIKMRLEMKMKLKIKIKMSRFADENEEEVIRCYKLSLKQNDNTLQD